MVLVALLDPIRPYFDLISPVTRPTQGDLKPAFEVATLALNALRMLSHLVLVAACLTTLFVIVGDPVHCVTEAWVTKDGKNGYGMFM